MPSAGNARAERLNRRQAVAQLYLRGHSQEAIAAELGVSQPTVSRDLRALQQEWQRSALIDLDVAKARELARVDELERTYWREWEASKDVQETTSTKSVQTGEGEDKRKRIEASVRKVERLGDPRYLAGVQWCIQRRCEILGIDAPKGIEHSGKIEVEYLNDWRQHGDGDD